MDTNHTHEVKAPGVPYIGAMKLLLIFGVVLIHCSLSKGYSDEESAANLAIKLCDFISLDICWFCVPCFFCLSGYLYFRGVSSFDSSVYFGKLKRRLHSLFIPYVCWCAICCVLLYVKHKFLHMPGLGIFLDGNEVDWVNFLKGFWYISQGDGYPYAFAFWFIRNLMVFIVLSPLAYVIGRWHITALIFYLSYLFLDIDFYGFEWFVAGVYFSCHQRFFEIGLRHSGLLLSLAVVVFCGCVLAQVFEYEYLLRLRGLLQVPSALYLVLVVSRRIYDNYVIRMLVPSTFMIYATHQCYCTIIRKVYAGIFGSGTLAGPFFAYICSFLTMIVMGYLIYELMRGCCPRVLGLITGGRL